MKTFKKIISIVIIFLLCFGNVSPALIYAQEVSESPTPAATAIPEEVVENVADITDEITSNSNTGENVVEITESPIPEALVDSSPLPTPLSEISTSESISIVEVENNVNSNVVNSEFIYHTLNIYLPESGDIDLSALTSKVVNKVYDVDNNLSSEVNIKVTDIDNFAYVENNITSIADTGNNVSEGSLNSNIETSDAYSVVSVLNNINTNIVDSKIHLVTINIFGDYTGNIKLPEYVQQNPCSDCNPNVNLSNTAVVDNQITTTTDTGNNKIVASGSAEIITGDAQNTVNVLNLVNTNFVNTIFRYLYINTLGLWVGDFLGWMGENPQTNDNININSTLNSTQANSSSSDTPCTNCSSSAIGGANVADVANNIISSSNTGNNQSLGFGDSKIKTGNAYSSVSLINLVNSNFVNSQGFVGFINIFGTLVGDIGGTSLFEEEIVTEDLPDTKREESSDQNLKESGGIIDVSHTNNVGTHVFPGDTITFQAKVKNLGYGKIYDTRLKIELFKDGISYGGSYFNLGEIGAQKAIKLTTGLVMSKKAFSGRYTAKVTAVGIVGPEDHEISSTSESYFQIMNNSSQFVTVDDQSSTIGAVEETPQILGSSSSAVDPLAQKMIVIFTISLFLYLILKSIQKRQVLIDYAYRVGNLLM